MNELLFYVVVGFVAQMIDGTLGMAYGVSASSLLLTRGLPPAIVSSTVHAAEVFQREFPPFPTTVSATWIVACSGVLSSPESSARLREPTS